MPSTSDLPYSFCKRYGVIAAQSPVTGKLRLTLKNGASADAVTEAQRLLGMVDEIEFESESPSEEVDEHVATVSAEREQSSSSRGEDAKSKRADST